MRLTLLPFHRQGIFNFEPMPEHFFCSQMVRVKPKDGTHPAETVLLEEISPQAMVLSGGAPFQEGVELLVAAEGFAAQLTVSQCEVREDSYVIRGDFGGGYRWSPQKWTPAHLYEVKDVPKTKAAGAS